VDDCQDKESDEKSDAEDNASHEHEETHRVKTVAHIELGKYEIETWYYSSLPPAYQNCKVMYCGDFKWTVQI